MRNHLVDFLMRKVEAGQANNLVFLTGDLGFSVLEPLQNILGKRFLNVGINEALMMSMAAAMGKQGYKVFTYSITPFATFRCLEQIRNDICYHNSNVTVVGVGAGFGYGPLGATHHALEDLAAIWSLPNMKVLCPADLTEAELSFEKCWNESGPCYLRIGKGGEGKLSDKSFQHYSDCSVIEYRSGSDLTFISTGHILSEILEAERKLSETGIKCQVLSVPVLKPFPHESLKKHIASRRILVVEELVPFGGFSGEVSKSIHNGQLSVYLKTQSSLDSFAKDVGSFKFQRDKVGLSASQLVSKALSFIKEV